MPLKTDYQDFIAPEGKRRFIQELNEDTTVTMTDVTEYEQNGDYMSAVALNTTNETVNDLGVATSTLVGRTGDLEDEVALLGRQLAEGGGNVQDGMFAFEVNSNGDLIMTYGTGVNPNEFYINGNGDLIWDQGRV